jgi:YVTN family beta-propeller protein
MKVFSRYLASVLAIALAGSVFSSTPSAVAATSLTASGAYIPISSSPTDEAFDVTDGLYFVTSFYGPVYAIKSGLPISNGAEINASSQISGSVSTGSGSDGICWDSTNDNIWVANLLSGSVSVVDPKSLAVIANFNIGRAVVVPICDTALGKVFITDRNGLLLEFNASTLQFEKSIAVGAGAEGIALDSISQKLYVGNTISNTISVIDAKSGLVTATISGVNAAYGMALNQSSGLLYVSDNYDNLLNIIDTQSNQIVSQVTGLDSPFGVAVSERSNIVYVADRGSSSVVALNGYTNSVMGTLSSGAGPVYPMVDEINNVVLTSSWQGYVGFFGGLSNLPSSPSVQSIQPASPNSLTWNLSDSADGGLPIETYSWVGACFGTGNVASVTCSGLSGGKSYTLSVTATNANGTSSPTSSTAIAQDVPGAPQIEVPTITGTRQAQWSWSDDSANGSTITSYSWTGACSGTGDVTTVTCGNLPGGSSQVLTVVATNEWGNSQASSSVVTMPITSPDEVAVTVKSGPASFQANWGVPASGGKPLTGYNVEVLSAAGQVLVQQTLPASATSFSAKKLANGSAYSFVITATNSSLLVSKPSVITNIVPLAVVKITTSSLTYRYGSSKSELVAKVSPASSGTVTFSIGSSKLCSASISSGVASCTVPPKALNAGTYSVSAMYSGNGTTAGISTSMVLTIAKAKSALSLQINRTKLPVSQVSSLVATAIISSPAGEVPLGPLTYVLDGQALLAATNTLPFANLSELNLSAGVHTIVVAYAGDTNFLGSTATVKFWTY